MKEKLLLRKLKKTTGNILILCLILSGCINVFAANVEYGKELDINGNSRTQIFSDVSTDHWAFEFIGELVEKGAISGYPDGKYRPNNTVTRAEFAKIMVIAAGLTAKVSNYSSYVDVLVTDWYSPYIETANDYLTGYINSSGQPVFKPNSAALREDVAVAIVKLKGYDTRLADISVIKAMFKDFDGISKSTQKYVALAVENGLMSGYPDETFSAQSTVTRAECAAILWRAFQYGSDNKTTDDTPVVDNQKEVPNINDEKSSSESTTTENNSKKYSVETLAKVNSPQSMVVNGKGNIYFVYDNQIKMLAEDKITTIADGDEDFAIERSIGEIVEEVRNEYDYIDWSYVQSMDDVYYFERFIIKGLVYDHSTDKVYALGYYEEDMDQTIGATSMSSLLIAAFDVENVSELKAAYKLSRNDSDFLYKPDGKLITMDNNAILYSGDHRAAVGTTDPTIYRLDINSGSITIYGHTAIDAYHYFDACLTATILSSGYSIIYKSHYGDVILLKFDLSSGKFSEKKLKTNNISGTIIAFTNNNGIYYFYAGKDIYSVSSSGSIEKYIDNDEIVVKDGLPLGNVTQFIFDERGNIIFYDETNKVIRRINK